MARDALRGGRLSKGIFPIRIMRENLREAMVYYWGRGLNVDPSHFTWSLREPA